MEHKISFGQIIRAHGINGEVRVASDLDRENGLDSIKVLFLQTSENEFQSLQVQSIKYINSFLIIRFNEIIDRDSAEKLKGRILFADRKDLILEDNTNFAEDIIGCSLVATDSKTCLGKVTGIRKLPVHDVYQVRTTSGQGMVPALLKIFPEVDIENKLIWTDVKYFNECFIDEQ